VRYDTKYVTVGYVILRYPSGDIPGPVEFFTGRLGWGPKGQVFNSRLNALRILREIIEADIRKIDAEIEAITP
jgi:hypothetical protein